MISDPQGQAYSVNYFRYYAIKKGRKPKSWKLGQSYMLIGREFRICETQNVSEDIMDWYLKHKELRFHGNGGSRACNCIRHAWGTWL